MCNQNFSICLVYYIKFKSQYCKIQGMYQKDLNKIGSNIRAERARKGYSQEKLAELANTTRRSISMIETGLQNPKILLLLDIVNILNIDINKILK